MQVPEDHSRPEGRYITFPVIVFRSEKGKNEKAPLLHLGAGGPGAPMYLDNTFSVEGILQTNDDMSIASGRDLFIIDPRGTGLSRPLLSCETFVDNELKRLELNLSLEDSIRLTDTDYFKCIDDFLAQGIDLTQYHSFSIARDIEAMRMAAGIDQWVLLGVSYGTTYALTIAELFPDSIEAMVFDSATFAKIKPHHNFVQRTTMPYRQLFNYCDNDPDCAKPDPDIESRIWALVEELSAEPILMILEDPFNGGAIAFNLNGDRLIAVLLNSVYSTEIFSELPDIVSDLQQREQDSIEPYVLSYVSYMLDRAWGDVSASAHYCYEDKPFIDFQQIEQLIGELPRGYIRESARYFDNWSKYCNQMNFKTMAPVLVPSRPLQIPTLFLQGRFDSVTPLSDVEANRADFSNHQLLTFDLSHSILTADECAEKLAAVFIEQHKIDASDLSCNKSVRLQ